MGLIEGNGSLLLNKKNNSVSCEIILRSKDIQTLYKIKKQLGGGNINKRSKIDAYRYRITKNNIIDVFRQSQVKDVKSWFSHLLIYQEKFTRKLKTKEDVLLLLNDLILYKIVEDIILNRSLTG